LARASPGCYVPKILPIDMLPVINHILNMLKGYDISRDGKEKIQYLGKEHRKFL